MNRRVLVGGGAAAAIMSVIGNVKGKAQGAPDKVFLDAPVTYTETFLDDGRIESIGQERGNRWHHMVVNPNPSWEYRNAIVYNVSYGTCEPVERLIRSEMPFGTPDHEDIDKFNTLVREFFDWSFAEFEYRERLDN